MLPFSLAWGEVKTLERTTAFEPPEGEAREAAVELPKKPEEADSCPQPRGCKYCLGQSRARGAPKPAGRLTLLSTQSRDPSSGARGDGVLRQGILVRKAGWGVQAGAGSSAKQCLGIPEPAPLP